MFSLIVLAVGGTIDEISNLPFGAVSELGAVAVLGWYCWHMTSTVLPKVIDTFSKETEASRQHHAGVLSTMVEQWEQIQSQQHADSRCMSDAVMKLAANCAAHLEKVAIGPPNA